MKLSDLDDEEIVKLGRIAEAIDRIVKLSGGSQAADELRQMFHRRLNAKDDYRYLVVWGDNNIADMHLDGDADWKLLHVVTGGKFSSWTDSIAAWLRSKPAVGKAGVFKTLSGEQLVIVRTAS